MTGWAYDGRKMTLMYEHGSVSFVQVSDEDAKNIGGFLLGLGLLLIGLMIFATGEAFEHGGRLISPPFAEGTEYVTLMVFLFGLFYSIRAGVSRVFFLLLITLCAFITAVVMGREAIETGSKDTLMLAFAIWPLGLLIAFAMLWPYPLWPGLLLACALAVNVPFLLLIAQISPGTDVTALTFGWVLALTVSFFGMVLRGLHEYQQDLESAHYVRYGD